MKHGMILAGAAALAFAGPVLAQGKGQGGNPGKGGGAPAKVERGGGGPSPKAERGGGPQRAERRQARGPERREVRAERQEQRGPERREVRDARSARADTRTDDRRGNGRSAEQRGNGRSADAQRRQPAGRDVAVASRGSGTGAFRHACPPGLAAKDNGCLPPGQARRLVGATIPVTLGAAMLPSLYQSWFPDDEEYFYRSENGYVYRIDRDRNLVDGVFPLYDDWTGAYHVGAAYPQDYLGTYNVPVQYRSWYEDGEDYYRYGDGAIYQVDPQQGLIEAVVSLLAGDLALGQPLPDGYDVYNVPLDYRDRYADREDAWYRYGDGHIYRVDPTTRLVQAIVETLT